MKFAFGALKRFLDLRYATRDSSACAEFSWEGHDENDPTYRRGWAMIGTAGRLVGHFHMGNGDDSAFVCERGKLLRQPAKSPVQNPGFPSTVTLPPSFIQS